MLPTRSIKIDPRHSGGRSKGQAPCLSRAQACPTVCLDEPSRDPPLGLLPCVPGWAPQRPLPQAFSTLCLGGLSRAPGRQWLPPPHPNLLTLLRRQAGLQCPVGPQRSDYPSTSVGYIAPAGSWPSVQHSPCPHLPSAGLRSWVRGWPLDSQSSPPFSRQPGRSGPCTKSVFLPPSLFPGVGHPTHPGSCS